jgi:hypothetical protein
MFKKIVVIFPIFAVSTHMAFADLPLTVEDLIADKNKFKLETSVSYFNQNSTNLSSQGTSLIDLGNGRVVTIPTPVTQGKTNTDTVIGTLGLRYGISDSLEMGVKTNGVYNQQRTDESSQSNAQSDSRLKDVVLTTQYQLTKDNKKFPDSLLFAEVSAYDKTQGFKAKSLSSALVGGTVYTVNDPIVLSLTGSYLYNTKRDFDTPKLNTQSVDLGGVFALDSLLGFAVNPDITLTTGVGWQLQQADKVNSVKISSNHTQTNLSLGMAYALTERSNLTANIRTNVSGGGGSTLSVGLSTKLGKLPLPLSEKYKQKQLSQ